MFDGEDRELMGVTHGGAEPGKKERDAYRLPTDGQYRVEELER